MISDDADGAGGSGGGGGLELADGGIAAAGEKWKELARRCGG